MGQNLMIIRKPGPQELDSTLILLEYQRDELEMQDYDPDHVAQTVKTHISKAAHCWFNAYQGTRPVGCIGGYLVQNNYTEEYFAFIDMFYVLNTHRDQGIYKELYTAFAEWAKGCDATKIIGGEINFDNTVLTGVLEGLGFSQQKLWIKE